MATAKRTGDKISIKPRKMNFPFQQMKAKYWFDDNSLLTTYFAALSATFPPGEQNFIDSVRHYRGQIKDKTLLEQIRGFIGQEGHHSQQHKIANKKLDELGLHASRIEAHLKSDIEKLGKKLTPEQQLASTVCMEHITAILAEYALTHPHMTEPMHPAVRELIMWHAVEEIEHKAVAFDVYQQCVGDDKLLRQVMVINTLEFVTRITCYQIAMLYWDRKLPNLRDVSGAAKFFFGRDGVYRKLAKPFKDFFREDFHPWDHDNAHLIERWKKEHAPQEHAEQEVADLIAASSPKDPAQLAAMA